MLRTGSAGGGGLMPRKSANEGPVATPIVNFKYENRTYQIDPQLRKVYRRFVEIETSRAAQIFSFWRSRHASV